MTEIGCVLQAADTYRRRRLWKVTGSAIWLAVRDDADTLVSFKELLALCMRELKQCCITKQVAYLPTHCKEALHIALVHNVVPEDLARVVQVQRWFKVMEHEKDEALWLELLSVISRATRLRGPDTMRNGAQIMQASALKPLVRAYLYQRNLVGPPRRVHP